MFCTPRPTLETSESAELAPAAQMRVAGALAVGLLRATLGTAAARSGAVAAAAEKAAAR